MEHRRIFLKNRLLCLITTDYVRTAFSKTGRAIKIDKRLPCIIGGRVGIIKSDRLRAPRLFSGMSPLFDKGNVRHTQRKTSPSRPEAPFGKLRVNSHADARPYSFWRDFQEL
jgi:hypothetical protein